MTNIFNNGVILSICANFKGYGEKSLTHSSRHLKEKKRKKRKIIFYKREIHQNVLSLIQTF